MSQANENSDLALAKDLDPTLRANFKVDDWKAAHESINFESDHKGKFLVDLFLSMDNSEHGYVFHVAFQLLKTIPASQKETVTKFVAEARELIQYFYGIRSLF